MAAHQRGVIFSKTAGCPGTCKGNSRLCMGTLVGARQQSHRRSGSEWANGGGDEGSGDEVRCNKLMLEQRKYLLLLAILATTVTYVAGLNPPGGVWLDTNGGHLTGNQILVVTYHTRYNAFSYSNATAFMASAVVILLLVFAVKDSDKKEDNAWLFALRVVMVLDLLALVVAYAAGASRDKLTTVLASLLVSPVFIYILLHTLMDSKIARRLNFPGSSSHAPPATPNEELNKRERGILMLLSIFATTITYTAGLNPPGGFWPDTRDGHRGGDPVLNDHHRRRFTAFFTCNTVSFVASLGAILLLLTSNFSRRIFLFIINKLNMRFLNQGDTKFLPQVCIWISLFGLVVAYATGSCRAKDSTTGVLAPYLVALIILVLVYFTWVRRQGNCDSENASGTQTNNREHLHGLGFGLEKGRSLLVLLATLVATVTYQACLNPPGGFWPDDRDGHKGGDPILLTKHAKRYRLFFYFNSMAFVTSLVVIFMLQRNYQNPSSQNPRTRVWWQVHTLVQLVIVMVLDLIGLIGAFAAGSCRDVNTSIHVIALAGGTLVYVVFHMVFFTMRHEDLHKRDATVEKKRKLLLLIIILAVTLTYQAGLTPPGGFWLEDNGKLGHHAGDPVLLGNYPRRYMAFFYLNATGFMASVALTILLVNPNLYTAGINCHALFVCMVAGLFGLMGAYAAGSSRHVRTSLYMIVLIGAVVLFVILARLVFSKRWKWDTVCGCESKVVANAATSQQSAGNGAADIEANSDATANKVSASASNEAGNTTSAGNNGLHGDTVCGCESKVVGNGAASRQSAGNGAADIEANSDGTANKVSAPAFNEPGNTTSAGNNGLHAQRKCLTLLGILAASVTYQAGLAPPGGVWPDNNDGHAVGNPILRDSNRRRYHIFFYFNSASFVASVVVITLQLLGVHLTSPTVENNRKKAKFLIQAAHGIMVVDFLGLLGAYAAGSSREWETSGYIVALVAAVASYIGIHLIVSFHCLKCCRR